MTGAGYTSRLFVTLKRGLPGKRHDHRRVVKALGLRKVNHTVERNNSPTIRGMVDKVKYLLSVETKEMRTERLEREAMAKAPREPVIVSHHPWSPLTSSPLSPEV
eukprot:TRINITY_DN5785_c0_g1_i4.p1 TRINITY_DN5785_c0_g1~~TRINITY_DN5785_c0_g1_i4.p1  ORF type:complete len:105 (-),score=14.72 TRINITY_DN5785_c0_g1_i4:195-509(-)